MILRLVRAIVIAFCLVVVLFGTLSSHRAVATRNSEALRILVAYNPKYIKPSRHILAAYESVLEEEGVAFQTIDQLQLLALEPMSLADKVPAIIFPDALCKNMSAAFEPWIESYLMSGGGIAAIYDTAVQNTQGAYLPSTLFKKFSGINHITYTSRSGKAYGTGGLRFKGPDAANKCEVPYGKLDPSFFMSGYGYGRLKYPVACNETYSADSRHPEPVVLAEAVVGPSETYPAIVTRRYGSGNVLYVNIPLGHLKANGDDLLLRSMLRFFLFKIIKLPHLLNVPYGKGGIVFNWHHDSNADWPFLEQMIEEGLLRKCLKYSMHITAGESVLNPEDGLGFDACGKGERFVQMLKPFGTIGSHGGWIHDWFAEKAEDGTLGQEGIKKYIVKNNQCLESVTGQKIVEYSAPKGVHPPLQMASILPEMGTIAYYYTGDNGSAPNRSFYKGQMVSDRMIAFPVMPLNDKASLAELNAAHTEPEKIQRWLKRTVDYAIENRTVRLLYSHPYDLYQSPTLSGYRDAFSAFVDHLEQAQTAGSLSVQPMSYFAQFMLQMLEVKCRYTVQPQGIDVHVEKAAGLKGLTIAFPKDRYQRPQGKNITVQIATDAYYATLDSASHESHFFVPAR